MSSRSGNIVNFALVGIGATSVHVLIGLGLVWMHVVEAFAANIVAFSVAFMVSYFGHHRFTFRSTAQHRSAMPRFLAVAIFGLVLNQAIVYGMVDMAGLSYALALAVIVATVPTVTYLLARLWAFASGESPSDPDPVAR